MEPPLSLFFVRVIPSTGTIDLDLLSPFLPSFTSVANTSAATMATRRHATTASMTYQMGYAERHHMGHGRGASGVPVGCQWGASGVGEGRLSVSWWTAGGGQDFGRPRCNYIGAVPAGPHGIG